MFEMRDTYTCHICGLPCRSFLRYINNVVVCAYCQDKESTDIRTYLMIKKLRNEDPTEYRGGFDYDWTE